ncbi:NACHT domain-containing protein [Streptomyces sp. NPDC096057]|uniref:NACHT domain-containing protein n=1 Tax=Streptomyces sp. NPDC096057 TaxID=3155543 RepID=UPI0033167F5C
MAGKVSELRRLGLAGLAQLVPVAGATAFWSGVRHHPVIAVVALGCYEMFALTLAFAGQVATEVRGRRVKSTADAVDLWLQRRGSGLQRVYLKQLRASVQDMETVGVATPGEYVFRMRQVYVDVSLVPQALHAASGEPYLGTVPGGDMSGLGRRRSLDSVLREAQEGSTSRVLAVVGGPGSGKTTLARNTALTLCERRWRPRRRPLPVLLYLRDHSRALLADQAPTMGEVAVSAPWLEGKVSAGWLERRLDRGGCVVLLDGLDEVADQGERAQVVAWVERQIARHPQNVYVVTSRPHGYESNPLPRAEVLQVRRFTGEQIETFLRHWSYANECRVRAGVGREVRAEADRSAEDLLVRLRDRPALYDLAANPLLLTMTANVHRYRNQLPGSRAELYEEMCVVLLHRRGEARGLNDATGLSGPQKQHVVQRLALAMMKAEVRDWPLRETVRAIRQPLRQVSGSVTPEVFLETARKSGLLVEREQGVYGFAHLTLQEYLAAAQLSTQRADTTVLTNNVASPWWRETILLWAAGNDASDVIIACLLGGTVPTLALAFECADQAKIVDPAVRHRLEAALLESTDESSSDPERRRLVAGLRATRALQEHITLSESAALCAQPVSHGLYALFVRDELADGRRHTELPSAVRPESDLATGMQAGDAERFIGWINTVTGNPVYRLPTAEELSDPAAAVVTAGLACQTVWTSDNEGTRLYPLPEAHWPYAPATRDQLISVPDTDGRLAISYARLQAVPSTYRAKIAAWAQPIAFVADAASIRRAQQIIGVGRLAQQQLILALLMSRALTRELARAINLDLSSDRGLGRGNDLDLRLARGIRAELHRPPFRALAQDLARVLVRIRGLTHDLAFDLGLHLVSELRFDITPVFDGGLAAAFGQGLARDLDRALAYALDLTPVSTRAEELDHLLWSSSAPVHTLRHDLLGALSAVLESRERYHVRYRIPGNDQDSHSMLDPLLIHDLDLALDLALDVASVLGLGRTFVAQTESLRSIKILPAPAETSSDDGLSGMLKQAAARYVRTDRQLPEDPASILYHSYNYLQGDMLHDLPQEKVLIEQILKLVAALRDRILSPSTSLLATLRTGLLTVIAAFLKLPLGESDDQAMALHLVWQSLIAHSGTSSQPVPNQILIIVRTRQ